VLAIGKRGGSRLRRVFIAVFCVLILLSTLQMGSVGVRCRANDEMVIRQSSYQYRNGLEINWSIETVDNDSDVGVISEIVLDSNDTPIIMEFGCCPRGSLVG
jgi:hypothetical protein